MLEDFQHLGDTFWQPDLRMCLFAVGIDPTPEKPAEYISPHMHSASFSVSAPFPANCIAPNLPFAQRP
jgi:hypothetical protein